MRQRTDTFLQFPTGTIHGRFSLKDVFYLCIFTKIQVKTQILQKQSFLPLISFIYKCNEYENSRKFVRETHPQSQVL